MFEPRLTAPPPVRSVIANVSGAEMVTLLKGRSGGAAPPAGPPASARSALVSPTESSALDVLRRGNKVRRC